MRALKVEAVDVLTLYGVPLRKRDGVELFALACGPLCLVSREEGGAVRVVISRDLAGLGEGLGLEDGAAGDPRGYVVRGVVSLEFVGRVFCVRGPDPLAQIRQALTLYKLDGGGFLGVAEWRGGGVRVQHARTFVQGSEFFAWANVVPLEVVQAVRRLYRAAEHEGA